MSKHHANRSRQSDENLKIGAKGGAIAFSLKIANTTLGEASGFSLAWTFMGHSYFYILFVGFTQLIGAWFLLWNKTKLIGVLILIPIMVNIIIFLQHVLFLQHIDSDG